MLIQIHEPGQTPLPHQKKSMAIGIDLGTTQSVVAIADSQRPQVLSLPDGNLVPSVVCIAKSGEIWVGKNALRHIQEGELILSIKRLMGKPAAEAVVVAGEKQWTAVEISAEILKYLKEQAEIALDMPITQAVITVPAYFDDAARQATKQAALLAGIEVLRLLNEPTAAAYAYGLEKNAEGLYAVYDLGGGTFDISILRLHQKAFQVIATAGDIALGGDDFDKALLDFVASKHGGSWPYSHLEKLQARTWKEILSSESSISYQLFSHGKEVKGQLTREDFNAAIQPLVQRTIDVCVQAITDAEINLEDLKGVVMVGGSTRVPLVVDAVSQFFVCPLIRDINPDEAVACGAGLQAEAQTRGAETILFDITPISLGLEMMGDLVDKIIPRNTPIPISRYEDFTTFQDGQDSMLIHVVQGEREFASECRSLSRFTLQGIPPLAAGAAKIRVTFALDADGVLSVAAEELTTGVRQSIQVQPASGLTEDDMMRLLKEGFEHAVEDHERRLWQEAAVDAKRLCLAVSKALEKDGALLTDAARGEIENEVALLQSKIEQRASRSELQEMTETLEKTCADFATERVNRALAEALHGKAIDKAL